MSLSAGFFGKIPTRGDFVRSGLPSDLVGALDGWWQDVLPVSRDRLGPVWADAWMEAPIWRFLLPPGCCGSGAVAGLWLPSTDKAGRLFPLTLAVTAPDWRGLARQGGFLDTAESVGLTAVEQDVTPDQLAAAVLGAARGDKPLDPVPLGTWWTQGSDRVAPARHTFSAMPDGAAFTAMLQDDDPA